jgi:MFS family permease
MDTLGAIAGPLIATLLLSHVSIRIIFLVSLIPGICAFLSILIFVKEKVRVRNETKVWQSIRSLSPNFISFLIPVGIFGISNFAPTLLILRAQELLTPAHGALLAGTFAVALYTWSNVAYAIVSYPISVLADKYSKKAILSIGYLLFGVLCFGFVFASSSLWFLILLFAVSGIYTAIIEPSEPALASTFLSEDQHGTGYGTLSSVQGVGDFLSSITVGILWTFLSPTYGFLFAGVLAVIAGVMMFRKI